MVLRESIIEVIRYGGRKGQPDLSPEENDTIHSQRLAVNKLSTSIVESIPPLLDFAEEPRPTLATPQKGRMARRFSTLFSLWVILRSEHTPPHVEQVATTITNWL